MSHGKFTSTPINEKAGCVKAGFSEVPNFQVTKSSYALTEISTEILLLSY